MYEVVYVHKFAVAVSGCYDNFSTVVYISSCYDVTGWQAQLVTQILTKVKGIFVQIAHQKNKKLRKNQEQCHLRRSS